MVFTEQYIDHKILSQNNNAMPGQVYFSATKNIYFLQCKLKNFILYLLHYCFEKKLFTMLFYDWNLSGQALSSNITQRIYYFTPKIAHVKIQKRCWNPLLRKGIETSSTKNTSIYMVPA